MLTADEVVKKLRIRGMKKLKRRAGFRMLRSEFKTLAGRTALKGGFEQAVSDAGFTQNPDKPLIIGFGENFVMIARDYD